MQAVKNEGTMTEAWQLGAGSEQEQQMIDDGKIVVQPDGSYELFSQEAVNGTGEVAQPGDYFKVDGEGYPYPNEQGWFEANHEHIEGDTYEQRPQPLECYQVGNEMPEEVQFLVESGDLTINEDDPDHYFNAELWGTRESAGQDATVIAYGTQRDDDGKITSVDFKFVSKEEFDRTYSIVDESDDADQTTDDESDEDADSIMEAVMDEVDNDGLGEYSCLKPDDDGNAKMYIIGQNDDGNWEVRTSSVDEYGNEIGSDREEFETREDAEADFKAKVIDDITPLSDDKADTGLGAEDTKEDAVDNDSSDAAVAQDNEESEENDDEVFEVEVTWASGEEDTEYVTADEYLELLDDDSVDTVNVIDENADKLYDLTGEEPEEQMDGYDDYEDKDSLDDPDEIDEDNDWGNDWDDDSID